MILLIALALQVLLLCLRLDLLDLWTDELSLRIVVQPIPEVLRIAAADVHPPLYYLLQHFWMQLPLGLAPISQMRLLSALFACLATVAVDRLWARRLPGSGRAWFLALWTASPCLLLYARMGRSYSLQMLAMVVGLYWARELIERPALRVRVLFCVCAVATLYIHYVPGIALLAGTGCLLLARRRWIDALAVPAVVLAAYLPWAWTLADSLRRWAQAGAPYLLTGNRVTEIGLKLVYGTFSFAAGETQPDWALVAGLALVPAAAWLVWSGARHDRRLAVLIALIAAAGVIGVVRWVSYPFIPARLLFLYPFFLLLLVRGREAWPRAGSVVCGALLVVSLAGAAEYFRKGNFLNKGYEMPFAGIAATIRQGSPDRAQAAVLCDTLNTDFVVLEYYLGSGYRLVPIGGDGTLERGLAVAADPGIRTLWLFRNNHDISLDGANTRLEKALEERWQSRRLEYLPFSPLQRALARASGVADPPEYFHRLVEFRR